MYCTVVIDSYNIFCSLLNNNFDVISAQVYFHYNIIGICISTTNCFCKGDGLKKERIADSTGRNENRVAHST